MPRSLVVQEDEPQASALGGRVSFLGFNADTEKWAEAEVAARAALRALPVEAEVSGAAMAAALGKRKAAPEPTAAAGDNEVVRGGEGKKKRKKAEAATRATAELAAAVRAAPGFIKPPAFAGGKF